MALFDSENELEFSNQPDEEYVCLPFPEKAEQEDEEEEEELVFFSTYGEYQQDEEKEGMDTEQQDLCQGSLSN